MGYAKKRQKMENGLNHSNGEGIWKSTSPFWTPDPSSISMESSRSSPQSNMLAHLQSKADSHTSPPLRLDIPLPQIMPNPILHQVPKRQLAAKISSAMGALETQIVSILDVIIDNGSSTIAALTLTAVPSQGTTISLSSIGDITIPAATTTPSGPSPSNSAPSTMTISVPGPSSQIVLSSPPSTPLPSNPSTSQTTISSSSGSSSSSSFSSSMLTTTESGQPTSTNTLPPSSSSLTSNNSTISTFTSTLPHTTITGTTLLPLTAPTSNSTRLSSTLSRTTSLSSGASITTGSSSRTGTSLSSHTSSASASTFATSTASASASASGSSVASVTGGGIGGSGVSATATSSAPSSSSTAAGGSTNQSSMPATPVLVGGVVGGVAGLTIFLLLLLAFFRWRRRKLQNRQLAGPDAEAAGNGSQGTSPMSQRFFPFRRLRPAAAEPPPTERGFQNFGGRRIESVLTSGGDGFGDPAPSSRAPRNLNLAGTSFLRDSRASEPTSVYTAPSSPPMSPGPQELPDSNTPRERYSDTPEFVTMRPGPARTPVTSEGPFNPPPPRGNPPPQNLPRPMIPLGRDSIGRSHPGQDGSRGSRFAEDVT